MAELNREQIQEQITRIENHCLHPMFRTLDAIAEKKTDQQLIVAMKDDLGWFDDIFNEAEAMCHRLIYECEQAIEKDVSTPKRIQRKRTKGWKKPANCVCVTRPGTFGNPFETAKAFEMWIVYGEIAVTQLLDRSYFPWDIVQKNRLAARRDKIRSRLEELRGKDLACYCGVDSECHADVLLRLANG